MSRVALDLDGKKFGMLTATNTLKKVGARTERLCYCDCGEETWAISTHLVTGNRVSCGCAPGMKLPPGQSARNSVLNSYKQRAKYASLDWSLTTEEFNKLIIDNCSYCGQSPSNIMKNAHNNGNFTYNGIDRVNNQLGYIQNNVISCCTICNRAKGEMSYEDFILWIKRLTRNIHALS